MRFFGTTNSDDKCCNMLNRSKSSSLLNASRAMPRDGDLWYCLKCRTYTATLNIQRKTFVTKNGDGQARRYHQGWCAVCNSKKSNMKPW